MSSPRADLKAALTRRATGRRVHGISATLLPFHEDGRIHWKSFEALVQRTRDAGLDLAVNMDTGFGDLLLPAERNEVLEATRRVLGPGVPFYAGAHPEGNGASANAWLGAIRAIEARAGIPVLVQSGSMHALGPTEKAALYARISACCEHCLAFELSPVFAPHGEIWCDETFSRLIEIPGILGAKHSSLERATELRRLSVRDQLRPEFHVYTGNDLAIDMVLYGSDYLLGLSTFSPRGFAARDRCLEAGELAFLERNDALQHLGNVGFRTPVPAYKHAAAQYLHIVGVLESDAIHPQAPRRPGSERVLLFDCARRLGELEDPERIFAERVAPFLDAP